jgi:hypothetical protein
LASFKSVWKLGCYNRPPPHPPIAVQVSRNLYLDVVYSWRRSRAWADGHTTDECLLSSPPSSSMRPTMADDLPTSSGQANSSRSSTRLPCSSSTQPSLSVTVCLSYRHRPLHRRTPRHCPTALVSPLLVWPPNQLPIGPSFLRDTTFSSKLPPAD